MANRKKKKAAKPLPVTVRIRMPGDYTRKLPMMLHADGDQAYEEIKERFRGRPRHMREAMNNAVMLYAKVTREKKLGPQDNIEKALKLGK